MAGSCNILAWIPSKAYAPHYVPYSHLSRDINRQGVYSVIENDGSDKTMVTTNDVIWGPVQRNSICSQLSLFEVCSGSVGAAMRRVIHSA
jgi:hypothetical protein